MNQPLKYIIESLLFVSEEPISIQQFKEILASEETAAIREALEELSVEYDQRCGGFELREVAGGYQLRTRAAFSEWVKRFLKPSPTRLSRAALETLAIIAYKQPIIRADIEHIRGVDCGGVLRLLLEKKLIRVLGRKDIPGRPMIYGTTRQFLEVFSLKDLRDLPSPKEIESLGLEGEEDYPFPEDATDPAEVAVREGPRDGGGAETTQDPHEDAEPRDPGAPPADDPSDSLEEREGSAGGSKVIAKDEMQGDPTADGKKS